MDFDILRQLITILEESSLAELEIEEDNLRVHLKKPGERVQVQAAAPAPIPVSQPSAETTPRESAPEPATEDDTLVTIVSPMVGVFYSAPAPGEAPYVNSGDIIEEGHTVCIVEAMKLMNEVSAKFRARIERVLVENGEPVEFGQALYAVTPLES
mgnify:CR=1 FL=1